MPFDIEYRPRRLSDVLGNDGPRRMLLARSRAGTLSDQSFMFGGPKGCGKTTLARIVAMAIKCTDLQDGDPCGECRSCSSILDKSNSDVEELDAASQGTVDRIRRMVKESDFGTMDGTDVSVYVVDEAQRLSKAAQDVFLSALESRLFVAILCTTEPHKIQGPLRDRLEEYPVQAPTKEDVVRRLRTVCSDKSITADDDALAFIVDMCGRTPRTSLKSLEAVSVLGPVTLSLVRDHYRLGSYEKVDRFLSLLDSSPAEALSVLDELSHRESPTWIRDAIVDAIAAACRRAIGAGTTFPVPVSFFPARGRDWNLLSSALSSSDRPSLAFIEAAALSSCPSVPVAVPLPAGHAVPYYPPAASVSSPPAPPASPPASPSPAPSASPPAPPSPAPEARKPSGPIAPDPKKPAPTPSPSVEVDGVVFSKDETLTSLDAKIVKVAEDPAPERPTVQVESDRSRVPISENDFASGFRARIRG